MSMKQNIEFIIHLLKLGTLTGEVVVPLVALAVLGLLLFRMF